ncbi:hypothetical protein [Acinetobacter sp.]|uniref:hypothetical protein n=1 Tax=Acinetobacter sp. TaxID=472 RepID=UPI00388D2425
MIKKFVMKALGIKTPEQRLEDVLKIHRENVVKLKRFDELIMKLAARYHDLPEGDFKENVAKHIEYAAARRQTLIDSHKENAYLVSCAEATLNAKSGAFM